MPRMPMQHSSTEDATTTKQFQPGLAQLETPVINEYGAPTQTSGGGGGGTGAAMIGTIPGSLQSVLQSLVASLQSLVSALGSIAGGGGAQATSVTDLKTHLQAELTQLNPKRPTTYTDSTTARGSHVRIETDPNGILRLMRATGHEEVTTLPTGETIRFNGAGLTHNDLDDLMPQHNPQVAARLDALIRSAFTGKPSLTEAETSALQAQYRATI